MSEASETQFHNSLETSFESLREQLASEEMGIRMKAVHASRSLNDAERFSLLTIAAEDSAARIRYDAVSQIGTVGVTDPAQALQILSDRLLYDPEIDVKAAAAASMGALQLVAGFNLLQDAYTATNDWMFQFSIVAAIGELGAPEGFDFLAQALENPNELVKIAAIGSLGDLGNPKAIELLIPLVEDPDWQVRHRVAQSLAHLGGAEAQAALDKLANDPMPQVAEATRSLLAS